MPLPDANAISGKTLPETNSQDILEELTAPDDKLESKEEIKEKEPVKEKEPIKEEIKEEKDEEVDKEEELEPEEIDELEELEKDLENIEGTEEDELELITPVPRAAILKKYPKLFEDFPYLEKAYYRERQFTEVFPTPADAKEAHEKAQTLDEFESSLLEGDLTKILGAVKEENKNSFAKLADNYLLALSKTDEGAYHHVVGNVIKSTIYNMVKEARTMGEKEGELLRNTAQILNQYVFGTANFTPAQRYSKEPDTEQKSEREIELDRREENYRKQRFETANKSLDTKIDNRIKSIISQHLDPKNTMTDYVRRNAERDVLETVWKSIGRDNRFKALKDKLWENAFKNDYDSMSMDRIETALISKAKTLLPTVIKKARIEALKGMGKRVKEENNDEQEESQNDSPKRRESTSPQKSRQPAKRGEIPEGMSNKDYIMSD